MVDRTSRGDPQLNTITDLGLTAAPCENAWEVAFLRPSALELLPIWNLKYEI